MEGRNDSVLCSLIVGEEQSKGGHEWMCVSQECHPQEGHGNDLTFGVNHIHGEDDLAGLEGRGVSKCSGCASHHSVIAEGQLLGLFSDGCLSHVVASSQAEGVEALAKILHRVSMPLKIGDLGQHVSSDDGRMVGSLAGGGNIPKVVGHSLTTLGLLLTSHIVPNFGQIFSACHVAQH